MSGLTGDHSTDVFEHEGTATPDLHAAESMCTEWTDEKHSLYLNLMEALFVEQLYNHDYSSMDLVDRCLRKQNHQGSNTLGQLNANSRMSSGQFKVHRNGCWKKINFERDQPQLGFEDESRVLLKNPWILHFKSADKGKDVASPNVQENGAPCSEEIILAESRRLAKGLKHVPMRHLSHVDSLGSSTEMSDQNFVDGYHEREENLSSLCRTKKMKTVFTGDSSKDQIVLCGKSPVTADPTENYASPEKECVLSEQESENMDIIAGLKSGCRPRS